MGTKEKTRPVPTGLWLMCNCLFVMLGVGSGREGVGTSHDNTSVVLSPCWNSLQEFCLCFLFSPFLLCVKEKSPRLLRTEVSDNVPEYSGPLFCCCCLNKHIFVFPNLCGALLETL